MFGKIFIALLASSSLVVAAPVSELMEKRITHSGQATFFETGLGACGWVSVSTTYFLKPIADLVSSGATTGT